MSSTIIPKVILPQGFVPNKSSPDLSVCKKCGKRILFLPGKDRNGQPRTLVANEDGKYHDCPRKAMTLHSQTEVDPSNDMKIENSQLLSRLDELKTMVAKIEALFENGFVIKPNLNSQKEIDGRS